MTAVPKTLEITPLGLGSKPRAAGARLGKGPATADVVIPVRDPDTFRMEPQRQSLWCWAAVTASLARYYGLEGWTQCRIVREVLRLEHDCCTDPSACNTPGFLMSALQHVGCIGDDVDSAFAGPATPAAIDAALAEGRPIAAQIAWADGGSHYVVLQRRSASGMLLVADSLFGTSVRSRGFFPLLYREVGVWLNTFVSRPPPGGEAAS